MRIHTRTVFDMSTGEVLEDEYYEYEGPVAEAKGGGDTETKTVAEPPEFQVPYIKDVLNQAQSLYGQGPVSYYPGQTVAGVNPTLQQGFDYLTGPGSAYTSGVAQTGADALGQLVAGADPQNNPYFQSTLDAILRPITENYTNVVMPGIDAGAVQAGQYGGARQGVAQGEAANAYMRNLGDTASQFGTEAYQAGLDSLGRSILAAPAVQQMGLTTGNTLVNVGGAERGIEQEGINALIDKFNFEQAAPYDSLSYYAGLVGNPLGGTTTSVGPDTGISPLVGAAAGALAGAGGYMMATGAANAWNPAGWAMMAGGALLGSGLLG